MWGLSIRIGNKDPDPGRQKLLTKRKKFYVFEVLDVLIGVAGGFCCILKALHGGGPKKKNIAFCFIPCLSIKISKIFQKKSEMARNTRQQPWHGQGKQPVVSEMSLYKQYRYRDERSRKNPCSD